MMSYWKDVMDWPLDADWRCEFCGTDPSGPFTWLIWGLTRGECRCSTCHVQYTMRVGDQRVTRPICLLKPEYVEAFKRLWKRRRVPVDQVSNKVWDKELENERVDL